MNNIKPTIDQTNALQAWKTVQSNLKAACSSGMPDAAGLRQVKALFQAWSDLEWELNCFNSAAEGLTTTILYPGPRYDNARLREALRKVMDLVNWEFGGSCWCITRKNAPRFTKRLLQIRDELIPTREDEARDAKISSQII